MSGPGSRAAVAVLKTIHTAVFAAELASICWLVLTGLAGRRDRTVAVAAGAVALESGVFLANAGVCPLTPLTERFGAGRGSVSDIFLPDAVARTIPIWSSSLIGFAVLLHLRSIRRDRIRASAVSVPRNEPERPFGPRSSEATVAVCRAGCGA